jgi:hypothetical protein
VHAPDPGTPAVGASEMKYSSSTYPRAARSIGVAMNG